MPIDLDRLNWGNYDLIVIDESHNFRNGAGTHVNTQENRYVKLMDKVIRAGVKTKVLMLSATPVNNRFADLKNQLALAYEGNSEYINEQLDTNKSIEEIFRQAQKAFNAWSKLEPEARTTDALLERLKPISKRPSLTDLDNAINYNEIHAIIRDMVTHISKI